MALTHEVLMEHQALPGIDHAPLPDVVVISWPHDGGLREEYRRAGIARLLLVAEGATAPPVEDCLEDWTMASATRPEVDARLAALRSRAARHVHALPALDDNGLVHFDHRWVALSPMECRLMAVLIERFGSVVSRGDLVDAGWPGDHPEPTIRPSMFRLRRRIAPLGLELRTIHARGYLLEVAPHQHQT